jgi:hypothetical protein
MSIRGAPSATRTSRRALDSVLAGLAGLGLRLVSDDDALGVLSAFGLAGDVSREDGRWARS